jgi:hypothetical protein
MRPWESVARPAERAGAWSCRRRLRGWGQVRSARGWRAGGDTACCRASGSFGAKVGGRRCRVLPSLGFVRQYHATLPAHAHSRGRALLSGVFGPRALAPFFRLASARALPTETAAPGAAPALDMAESSWLERTGWGRARRERPGPRPTIIGDHRISVEGRCGRVVSEFEIGRPYGALRNRSHPERRRRRSAALNSGDNPTLSRYTFDPWRLKQPSVRETRHA